MKRLLILLILLFALPAYAEQCSEETPCPELARLSPAMMGSVPVAGVANCAALGSQLSGEIDTDDYDGQGYTFGNSITVGASNCKINKWYYYSNGGSNGKKIRLGIYADSGNHPTGDPIVSGGEITLTATAGAWLSAAFPETTLTAGTKYWLIVIGDASAASLSYIADPDAGTLDYMAYTHSNYPTFNTWSGTSGITRTLSAYVIGE